MYSIGSCLSTFDFTFPSANSEIPKQNPALGDIREDFQFINNKWITCIHKSRFSLVADITWITVYLIGNHSVTQCKLINIHVKCSSFYFSVAEQQAGLHERERVQGGSPDWPAPILDFALSG